MIPAIILIALTFVGVGVAVFFNIRKTLAWNAQFAVVTVMHTGYAYRFSVTRDVVSAGFFALRVSQALQSLIAVWSPAQLHQALDNLSIIVQPIDSWVQPETGRSVAGESFPSLLSIKVDQKLRSLAHEMAHIADAGMARTLSGTNEHERWDTRGIWAALNRYDEQTGASKSSEAA